MCQVITCDHVGKSLQESYNLIIKSDKLIINCKNKHSNGMGEVCTKKPKMKYRLCIANSGFI